MAAQLQVQNRREEIVRRLMQLHGERLVRRLSSMIGQGAIAEEIVQDTYMRLLEWPHLETVPAEDLGAVMFTTAHRLAVNWLRDGQTAARKQSLIEASHTAEVHEPLGAAERSVMAQQAVARLAEIIDSLPARLREVMVARYVEDLPREVICTRLRISAKNLEHRIREARATCHEQLKSSGFDWLWL